jgi:hypothetical protein
MCDMRGMMMQVKELRRDPKSQTNPNDQNSKKRQMVYKQLVTRVLKIWYSDFDIV